MPNVTRPIETQRLFPPSNAHVQSTCDPSFAVPGYVSGVQQRVFVFDCAVVHKGLSLNQVLMQGPDLVNNLVGVL